MAKAPPPGNRPLKTLERVFSRAGLGSRAQARRWIGNGRVQVNGKVLRNPDHWVDLELDRITLDGRPIRAEIATYILLYKPAGFLTTRRDPEGRPTIYDLLGAAPRWVVPVGRLDLDTSGLLLLTNDTQFAEAITNPERHVPKTYQVKASNLISDDQLDSLRRGVQLNDGPTRPAEVVRLRDSSHRSYIQITITEGRNRQVRRMFEAVGSKVVDLVRTAIGPLQAGDLKPGEWRELSAEEVRRLTKR